MSGYETCAILRKEYSLFDMPIMMITAKNQSQDVVAGFDAGANDYLFKPFDKKELLARTKTLLIVKEAYDNLKQLVDKNTKLFEESDLDSNENMKLFEFKDLIEINKSLETKINDRSKELQEKNKHIIESINYAKRIQLSILPNNYLIKECLKEFFILWRPKDIVGGDIYWFSKFDENYLISVIDCTGHGVPGAFMTMTANSVLNRITGEICFNNPATILNEMNKFVRKTLNQKMSETDSFLSNDNGMDMGLCYVMPKENKLIYAGAKIQLYISKNNKNEITVIKPDRQTIGYNTSKENFEYTNHEITLTGDETFYLTSDGLTDQKGGEKNIGFSKQQFEKFILENSHKSLIEQKIILETILNNHIGDKKQNDDITVFGFKP